ncbi:Phosphatidylinositol 3,4,5-trisphosphate 3-phosphatase and protein-tyrosine-phosphatase pten2a [Orobanche minor]
MEMSLDSPDSSSPQDLTSADTKMSTSMQSVPDNSEHDVPSKFSATGISTWAKNLKISKPFVGSQEASPTGDLGKSPFTRFTSGFGLRTSPKSPQSEGGSAGASPTTQSGFIGTITKGLVDSSKNAVKAVQVKARHVVSQNKRRYQEGGFDLDMTYITENIIAMGFPAGDMSSGFFGYVEGFYRNHMEEVIKFFETYHKDKYKVYNLCSERLYDASLFEGKVASFPFDDHNCPPIQLITSFCQSAYSWLKEDIENVVVVHCKAGMARTGLMISSLLLYLKFFPTAEESIDYYNQKRCIDGKGLVLPSQIRYVKYFERILAYFNGENQPGRRYACLEDFGCIDVHTGSGLPLQYLIIMDLSPEDFWFSAPKKGIMVFALPGEPGLTELAGDFKVHFHDRQGDFYCWLNTTMVENRKVLNTSDFDGFDKRKLPSPGFLVEVVLVDYEAAANSARPPSETLRNEPARNPSPDPTTQPSPSPTEQPSTTKNSNKDKNDEFSDSEGEETTPSKSKQTESSSQIAGTVTLNEASIDPQQMTNPTNKAERVSIGTSDPMLAEVKKEAVGGSEPSNSVDEVSEFKAMAADASVFSFGDDEDYESE